MTLTVTLDTDRCSRCSQARDDLIDRAHGERICHDCRELERVRYEDATGECVHGCGYALAWHQQPRSIEDECPTEAEARAWSGAQ
jgi:recombinational DNA repair protein (RecF pathway)